MVRIQANCVVKSGQDCRLASTSLNVHIITPTNNTSESIVPDRIRIPSNDCRTDCRTTDGVVLAATNRRVIGTDRVVMSPSDHAIVPANGVVLSTGNHCKVIAIQHVPITATNKREGDSIPNCVVPTTCNG